MGSGSQTGKPSAQLRVDTSEAKQGHDLAQCASHPVPQIGRGNDPKLHFCFVLNNIINTGKENTQRIPNFNKIININQKCD